MCGNPEVVEDRVNGLLVDPARPETLQGALEELLADEELGRRFAAAGLERKGLFERQCTFSEVEAVLLEAAKKRGG